jgi:hypothetical protein
MAAFETLLGTSDTDAATGAKVENLLAKLEKRTAK